MKGPGGHAQAGCCESGQLPAAMRAQRGPSFCVSQQPPIRTAALEVPCSPGPQHRPQCPAGGKDARGQPSATWALCHASRCCGATRRDANKLPARPYDTAVRRWPRAGDAWHRSQGAGHPHITSKTATSTRLHHSAALISEGPTPRTASPDVFLRPQPPLLVRPDARLRIKCSIAPC